MVCFGFEPRAAGDKGWKAQMNPLSYGNPPQRFMVPSQFIITPRYNKMGTTFCLTYFVSNSTFEN